MVSQNLNQVIGSGIPTHRGKFVVGKREQGKLVGRHGQAVEQACMVGGAQAEGNL